MPNRRAKIGRNRGTVVSVEGRGDQSTPSEPTLEADGVFVPIDFAVLASPKLTAYDVRVFGAFLTYTGFPVVDPTITQLSRRCHTSVRQVQRAIRNLEKSGLITRKGRQYTVVSAIVNQAQWAANQAQQATFEQNVGGPIGRESGPIAEPPAQQAGFAAHQAPTIEDTSYRTYRQESGTQSSPLDRLTPSELRRLKAMFPTVAVDPELQRWSAYWLQKVKQPKRCYASARNWLAKVAPPRSPQASLLTPAAEKAEGAWRLLLAHAKEWGTSQQARIVPGPNGTQYIDPPTIPPLVLQALECNCLYASLCGILTANDPKGVLKWTHRDFVTEYTKLLEKAAK